MGALEVVEVVLNGPQPGADHSLYEASPAYRVLLPRHLEELRAEPNAD